MKAVTSAVITPMAGGIVIEKYGSGADTFANSVSASGFIIDGNNKAPVKYDERPAATVEM